MHSSFEMTTVEVKGRKEPEMFFKDSTIYKVYTSLKSAESYIARHNTGNMAIEEIGGRFFVVGA